MTQAIAVQKRLYLLLTRQLQKLTIYAHLLEKELISINELDVEKLTSQQQAEKLLISELVALEKAIVPLEKMYQALCSPAMSNIDLLKAKLLQLKQIVLTKNASNQRLAETKLADLKEERLQLRKNKLHSFALHNSPYNQQANPTLFDIMY